MFKVLHSSAGAGKTHALVKNYLKIALGKGDPATYSRILALTFTNKAAAEMRERILQYLVAIAEGTGLTGAETDVRDNVVTNAGISPEAVQRRAEAVLHHILHHWPQLAVSTIDAFTRRVVAPFARDLQLDQELRMTTEEPFYRAKAVDLLLEQAGSDAALTEVLVATGEQLLEEERPWRPDLPLYELSGQLSKEHALEHLAALRSVTSQRFIAARASLRQRTGAFREGVRALGREMLDAVDRADLEDKDLANGSKGFISYFRKLGNFSGPIELGKNTQKALEQDKWHSGSASPQAVSAINGLAPLFRRTIEKTGDPLNPEMRQYLIDLAVLRDLMATASLNAIDQCLEELKHEDGVSFFSDLTRKVMAIVQEEPAPFLYERLGERYRHFLIDEFQDTSLMQWHALLPLVENALSSDGSVLLVGDAKQAIYRWRNGEARQFVELPSIFRRETLVHGAAIEAKLCSAHEPVEPLASNRRSARNIINFNNEVIETLKQELDEGLRSVYGQHAQEMVRQDKGYVEAACFVKRKEDEEPAPWALMLQAVQDCLADGSRPGDIAVLVRTKAKGREAAHRLVSAGWNVVSPDGLALGANPAACAVMSVLAWLQRPTDETSAMAAQSIASLRPEMEETDPFSNGIGPREFLRRWHAEHPLVNGRLPLTALICRISEALGHGPASDAFVMGLAEEAHLFSKTGGDDLPGFLEHWARTASGRSINGTASPDAVQVMTVHKAKGLQFPVVIVPEAGTPPGGGRDERLWISPGDELEGIPATLVRKSKELSGLGIPELEEEERLSKLDELNVLYVALTRPEQRLYLSVDGAGDQGFAKALRGHLGLSPGETWTLGNREPNTLKSATEQGDGKPTVLLEPSGAEGQEGRTLAIRLEAPDDWDPANPDPYRSHGRAVHAVLARVHTPEDLPAAIAMESSAWGLSADTGEALRRQLATLLEQPALGAFFREGLEVRTESTLLDANGRAFRPDRVVRDGNVFRILDIKTGSPAESHKEQVRKYAELLHAVEDKPVEAYLLYVRDGLLEQVRV